MISQRLIVGLQIYKSKLIKTEQFKKSNSTYLGDVLNAVRIFNEKKVDELIIYDLTASKTKEIDFLLLEKISRLSRMPLCYGGGIDSIGKAKKLSSLGFEKLSFNSLLYDDLNKINQISKIIGRQSIVLSVDYKKIDDEYFCFKNSGTINTEVKIDNLHNYNYEDFAGEIILNDINNDGSMKGYNSEVINKIYKNFKIPLTLSGGFKNLEDIKKIFNKFDIIGVCCSSYFFFKGTNKAVLLNYPDTKKIENVKR